MKLNTDAFLDLYHYHNQTFYADSLYDTFNGYLVLAVDGSSVNIPTTPETIKCYGSSSRKNTKPQASLGLSCLYDVMNHMILESDCNRCKFNEMEVAEQQIDKINKTIGLQPFLVVMDRGYPSMPAFIRMMEKNVKFLVRLKSSDYKQEQALLLQDDAWVDIELTKSRMYHYKGNSMGEHMKELGKIRLRMIKVTLENGTHEVLLTNLSEDEFNTAQIYKLYNMRWGIETAFETLKSRLQLENFTGTKPVLLLQDVYSTIYVSNLTEDIIRDMQQEQNKKETAYKHKMAINQTLSIGILKNDLIYILMESNVHKQELFKLINKYMFY